MRGMKRAIIAMGLAVASITAVFGHTAAAQPADVRPNIVLIYLDDVSPNTTWLWDDPERTPSLARFATEGVEFRQAIGSTPLCGPARASLLTGQYGHNHEVTINQAAKFEPRGSLAPRLKRAGYHTILVGKYISGLDEAAPNRRDVLKYARGWKRFDVIWKRRTRDQGQFYDYTLWTRHGLKEKGARAKDHSTWVTANRVAKHIRKAPPGKPVFAVASLASGHVPHTPLAWDRGSSACRGVKTYRAPSLDEPNVSDKPRYIRKLPRLRVPAVNLRSWCQEMLGVETVLERIEEALEQTGRADNTLLLFTSDNGYLLGDHRMPLPGGKKWPHAVTVPLYALWPARLGNERRVVDEPVSNIDIPVTICKLAGCRLRDADGMDLMPLMTGEAAELDRRFVYTEMLWHWGKMPSWYGLVTTSRYSADATWQYTEYANGGRELYNLTRDPQRLKNLARLPRLNERVRQLHRILHRQVVRPDKVVLR